MKIRYQGESRLYVQQSQSTHESRNHQDGRLSNVFGRSSYTDLRTTQAIQANHGASIADIIAIGPESGSVQTWRESCGIETNSQIRLVKLAHMRYQHPDLEEITVFLQGIVQLSLEKAAKLT